MRISRKIGISFFITFLLVILLGLVSIYSLRHIYRGLSQVFAKDLPASRSTYQIAISMEEVLSELNNFLITGNENFKISYQRSYKRMQEDASTLRRFMFKEEEKGLFKEVEDLTEDINKLSEGIFKDKKEIDSLFKGIKGIEIKYREALDKLFDFKETKMLNEKDLLLIQAQHIPASALIMEARLRFSNLLDKLIEYAIRNDKEPPESIMDDLLALEKAIGDYKNYHGYSLSDKERSLASGLIDLSGEIRLIIDSIIALRKEIDTSMDSLIVKEKNFMETLDKIIAFKKSGISSKLGVGAALTEDIPAIHDISKIEKDITRSWRLTSRYILTTDETYKESYYQLRQNIDKELKDYGRHVRLRGTENFLDDILESDKSISEAMDSNMEAFDKKENDFSALLAIKAELERKLDELLERNSSFINQTQDSGKALSAVPARWILMKLKGQLSDTSRLVTDYLNQEDLRYKDMYSEVYFDMKKEVNRYRNISTLEKDSIFIKDIEQGLDRLNTSIIALFDSHDRIMKERGWSLIKLEETLKERLDKAVSLEISQIDKNKKDLKNRIAMINSLIFIIIGVVALIAIFIIFYTTNCITNPIQKLYDGAEVIGSGNLDHRLDIKTGDEIQDLAEGFNRMAGELKELYTNLENKVKERTFQLAEANEALGLKNKELDDFTYIVSHDLKEPLRGVKAFAKLLMEDYSKKVDEEGKEHLRTILDSSSRMTGLIEDLLNLSRIGRIKNIEPDVDLNDILSDVKKNLAYSLEEKNADLKIGAGFPTLTCDRVRIREVFSNLISNAIKYSKKGTKPIVELGYSDKPGFYEFYVKDNGIGIEKEYYDKVFQIFQRLHAKGEYEGTGAGLTIVKKIIENHGGKIWVASEVGIGSTFYFTLPKSQA